MKSVKGLRNWDKIEFLGSFDCNYVRKRKKKGKKSWKTKIYRIVTFDYSEFHFWNVKEENCTQNFSVKKTFIKLLNKYMTVLLYNIV